MPQMQVINVPRPNPNPLNYALERFGEEQYRRQGERRQDQRQLAAEDRAYTRQKETEGRAEQRTISAEERATAAAQEMAAYNSQLAQEEYANKLQQEVTSNAILSQFNDMAKFIQTSVAKPQQPEAYSLLTQWMMMGTKDQRPFHQVVNETLAPILGKLPFGKNITNAVVNNTKRATEMLRKNKLANESKRLQNPADVWKSLGEIANAHPLIMPEETPSPLDAARTKKVDAETNQIEQRLSPVQQALLKSYLSQIESINARLANPHYGALDEDSSKRAADEKRLQELNDKIAAMSPGGGGGVMRKPLLPVQIETYLNVAEGDMGLAKKYAEWDGYDTADINNYSSAYEPSPGDAQTVKQPNESPKTAQEAISLIMQTGAASQVVINDLSDAEKEKLRKLLQKYEYKKYYK